jgi:hypothetical protein
MQHHIISKKRAKPIQNMRLVEQAQNVYFCSINLAPIKYA